MGCLLRANRDFSISRVFVPGIMASVMSHSYGAFHAIGKGSPLTVIFAMSLTSPSDRITLADDMSASSGAVKVVL